MSIRFDELPPRHEMVRNILDSYIKASPEDLYDGAAWYRNANWIAQGLSEITPYTLTQVAAVLAVLSPAMTWDENETAPGRALDLHLNGVPTSDWAGFSTYPANLEKAARILDGDLSALGGNKVTRFFANIMGFENVVTVDRWAIRVALAEPQLGKNKITPSSNKVYKALENAYIDTAELVGVSPSDMQAITWVSVRRKHNGKPRPRKDFSPSRLVYN